MLQSQKTVINKLDSYHFDKLFSYFYIKFLYVIACLLQEFSRGFSCKIIKTGATSVKFLFNVCLIYTYLFLM
jgi:hypothetical protein